MSRFSTPDWPGAAGEGAVAPPALVRIRRTWLPSVAVVALAAAAGVWQASRPVSAPANPFADARFTLLVNWEGAEEGAEISPDGEFVAFLADIVAHQPRRKRILVRLAADRLWSLASEPSMLSRKL